MKNNIKDIYSLTPAQEGMYAQYYQNRDTKTYQLQNLSRISKEVDLSILEKSVELLSVRHQVLKSAFTVLKSTGAIKQVILENRKPAFTVISNDEPFSQEALDKIISDNIPKSLDLQKDSLFRVTIVDFIDARFMLMHAHHIILDGWCLPVLINDLQKYYGEIQNGKSIEVLTDEIKKQVSSETSYAQYANWIRKQNTDEVSAYWKNLLTDNEPSHIFGKEKKDNSKNEDIISFRTPLNNDLSQSIEQFAKENKVSPNSVFECAFSIALQKFSGSEDVIFDKTISGRSIPLKNIENTVGPFINTVPVRIQTNENSTLAEVLKETQNQTINANTNGILSLADLYKQAGIDAKSVDSLFVFENYYTGDGSEISNGPLAPQLVSFDEQTEFNLTVTILKQNNGYAIRTSYAKDFYTEKEAKSFVNGYISVLESSIDKTKLIKDISVLTEEEKNTILYDFNNTKAEYSKDKCIHELFEEQVERTPDKIALVAVDKKVTYAELNEEANRIANSLVEKGIGKGDIVGLMLPRKSYLLSALFGILKTGAAYLPIDMELPEERIEYMCKDTNAKFVVSMDNIDSLLDSDNTSNPNVDMTNESLCYCIYTSGSTGNPKGVMAKHRNVVNYISRNEHNIFGKIVKEDFEAIVSISTCSFDIFVTETIATLVNGLRVVLADEQECRNQYALNRLLTREKGQFLQTTPTKLKALTKEPSQREFLKNIKAILLGGEAMEQSYLDELKELTNAKIYNIYGVTEVPIWSVFADTDTFTDAITIGKPIANTQVYIVDKYMNPVPMGIMGELCIAGDSVSIGYLNRPELTEEKFVDNPFGSGKLYKTGDHAYWRDDGNLVFIGRKDFQVKIRGLRIELGEIESVLQAVEGIERAVVVVRKDKEDRQLLCAFYTGEDFPAKDLRAILSTKLPKYMVPHIFTHLEEMPMTASGKANRNALPEIDLSAISTETEYVAPKTKEEKALTESIETTLDIQEVSTLDNFFDLGGDSLKSIELVSELEDKGYTVNVKAIFEAKDIQSLAKELTVKEGNDERIEYSSILPATAAQMRIYTSQLISPDSVHYNILAAFKTEELDIDRLQKAVNELIVRHESLRTSFENRNGQIIQIINEPTTIEIEKLNSADSALFNTPFDLSTASLLKVGCYDNTVVVVAHHIIVDGESMTVLCKELNELYMGRELPETVQYGEFAVTDNYTEENEKYWLKVFNEETTELRLPTDYQRPEKQSFNGTNIQSTIDNELNRNILDKCKQLGITPYVYYMACYNILLSKYSGNEDICVGMPISGRSSKFLNTIGMFVNTVVLRTNTDGNKVVNALMQEIRENSISAIDNQMYPYNELVKKLGISSSNRNPLYDVMFAYQNEAIPVIVFGDKEVKSVPVTLGGVKCDLNFNIVPTRDKTVVSVEYSTDLFKEETINKFIKAYTSILTQCLDETKLIKDISVLTEEEKEKVISSFNNTEHTYNIPENTTLYSLFEKKSEENKDKVCIIANEEEIKFKDFKLFAERIDNKVRSITNENKSVIAVICERSFEMYGAVYGIIRGGNAYLPIDPNYPQDRIDYILENSGAKAVIAQDKFCHLAGNVPCINATEVLNNKEVVPSSPILANEEDTAYVIYTSGSTGNPKGAKISHKSAINRILWMHDFYPLEENDVILQKTPYTFDVSVWELFWWGITGRTLCASKPDEHFLPAKILEETYNNKVTHLHFVPSVFDLFLTYLENNKEEQSKFNSVKYVFLSGEALTANHINRFYNIYDYNKVQLHNLYGPTECAVDVSYYACTPTDIDPVPIGKPIYNTQLHIVDKYMNPTPIGVTGELCIAGVNVGQGYLNNEQLTNVKFIDNPFGSGKLYKTGDLAYWREDGNICYVGRNDFQVKINGQRIELGEIENAIVEIDGVVQCAVVVREQYICAFYTGAVTDTKDFRNILSTKLPRYMVPHIFTHLDSLPMTVSGKLDRKALPPIDFNSISTETEYIAPETEAEKALAKALSTVLNVERVSMLDNFFNIGGDSINAIYVVSELEDMHYSLQVADIMQSDTLKDIVLAMKSTSDEDNYDYGFIQFDATEIELNELKETHTDNIEYIYSLTPSQEGMYAQYYQNTDTKTYQLQNLSRISKEVDLEILSKSVELLSVRHQVLKSAFTVLKSTGAIKQVILENRKPAFNVIALNETYTEELLNKAVEENTKKSLDLQKDSLFRVTIVDFIDARFMLMHAHHIILDGWCLPVLINDVQKYYGELQNNKSIEALTYEIETAVASETSYAQYANWIRKQNTDEVSAYWKNLLTDNEPSHIFGKEKKDNSKNEDIISFRTPLNNDLSKSIEQFAKENKVSPNSVFECAFSIALQKFSGSEDVIFDKTISGRSIPLKNIENTVGPFINTVPVRIQTNENSTLAEVLKETQNQTINANTNGILSLADLYKQTGIDAKSIDSLFVFENYYTGDGSEISNGPLAPQLVSFDEQTEFNLTVTILKQNNGYAIRTSYAKDFYTEKEAKSFVNGYISVLESSIDKTKLIKDISVLTEEEKEKVISSFNNTEHTYNIPENTTLYSLFEKKSEENKDKVCIIANEEEISFADFKLFAERIDNKVRSITNEEKSVIAVIAERSFEMYGAVYGIIRGGNAYLPIDPNYPQDRIDYILENSGAKAVIAQDKFCHLAGNVPCINATEVLNNKEVVPSSPILANEEDTAYVIYTSGSTGNPKGAKISHKSAINRILWMHDFYPLEENDVILQKTPYTFDVSVWELFWWGITGRTLCASKPDEHFLPAKILQETEKNKVTHLHFVPSVFDLFLTYLENNKEEQSKFNSVKYVFLSGEALTANSINRFYNIYDYNKVQLHNLYGPTECAVDVSYYACTPTDIDPVPIGKPIYNTQLYIVDKYLNPTPIGVTGELCIAGVNVGQGYLNNEQLTNEKFIDNPFGSGKLYKTGDLAYWRNDGQIIYVGRMDGQIKLNGQRVELGEIEKVISEVADVESVAIIIKENNGQDVLVAFCCGNPNAILQIISHCESKLPQYMVPAKFQFIPKMPLNQSGKLDRKALKNIDVVFDNTAIKEEPITDTEKIICGLFQDVLGIDFVGRNESFFTLGGTSLDMIAILSENGMQNISAADFIANPTPEKLAKFMESDTIVDSDGFYTLRNAFGSTQALILIPYAGGDASAFAALTKVLERIAPEMSVYYVDYLRSYEQCEIVANKIKELSKAKEINIYSHCAGTAVALQLINILEKEGVGVSNYITGGFIPSTNPPKRNGWNYTFKRSIQRKLIKAGAPIEKFSAESNYNMVEKFRKDTDFMTEYFYKRATPINAKTSVIISKTDIFTQNYAVAETMWRTFANNFDKLHYIDTNSHYFQTEKSEEVAQIIIDTLNK